MYRDYEPQGVKFYFIYKSLAHPETNGYVQPLTLKERLLHVKEAQRRLGSKIPWICDSIDNAIKHAMGDRPNSEFIIDPHGKIVRKRQWSRPEEVRKDLIELVGPVDKPTKVADLKLKTIAPPKAAKQGVVKRLPRSRAMRALKIEATKSAGDEQPIRLKVDYFACNDDAGWCKAVSQEYTIHLKADADAGRVSSGRRGRGRRPPRSK